MITLSELFETVLRMDRRTSDRDTAHVHASQAFVPHDLGLGDEAPLDFRLSAVATGTLAAGVMAYGTSVTILAEPMEHRYHMNLPVRGDSVVAQNGVRRSFTGGTTGVIFGPSAPLYLRWSADSEQYHLSLSKTRLEAHAARLAGVAVDGDLDFDLTFDLDTPRGRTVLSMTTFLRSELTRDDGMASVPVALHEFESALMTQLLMTIPNRLSPLLEAPLPRRSRDTVRAAIEYLREHARDDVTLADVAAATGASVRALQAGFRREAGMSPTEFLRITRLDGAHRDLALRTGSVSEVATRWHFYHVGRFASQYRARFGMLPSETLRGAS